MVQIRFFNAVEMSSKSVLDPQQGLSNVLDPASMACNAIYEVRASARDVLHAGMYLSSHRTCDKARFVKLRAVPT